MTDLSLANGGERESELGLKFVTFVVEVLKLVYIYIKSSMIYQKSWKSITS